MGDHMIDVVQRDAHCVKHFVEQQWGVGHGRPVDAPGVSEHSRGRLITLGVGETQSAVVGHGRESGELYPFGSCRCPFEEKCRSCVAEGQRCQLLAHDVPDVPGCILAELRDVLTADHQ